MESITYSKSEQFALDIIKLYKNLTETQHEKILSSQILRSGTSIGANLAESQYAISKSDFINKISISLKECNETLYWLSLLYKSNYITDHLFNDLQSKCEEIKKLLISTLKTSKKNV